MTTKYTITPYVFFNGKCEEAIEFYKKAAGAEVSMLMRFKDAPPNAEQGCSPGPEAANKIMHGEIRIGQNSIMVSDGRCEGNPKFDGFALSLTPATTAEAEQLFKALSQGGQVVQPLSKTFF